MGKQNKPAINPISLYACVASENHFNKIVISPSKGYHTKEDELHGQLVASTNKLEGMDPNSVIKLIMN